MLRELRIENLLLIERAELRFEAGLNAITGETGAGKTVLAHSIDLLLGGKPRSGIVRPGASEAWIEGSFDLPAELRADEELAELLERVPEDSEELVLARRVSASGRSSAFLAGRAAAAADLRLLGGRLLSFYGQHEHRRLTLGSVQAEILDGFAGAAHLELRERYRAAHARLLALRAELAGVREREGARERDLDLLRFELAEIEEFDPEPGEHEALRAERDRLRGSEELRAGAGEALQALSGSGDDEAGAAGAVAVAEAALGRAGGIDSGLDRHRERVASLAVELADLAGELRAYLDGLEADPARLDELEQRLETFERLLRKYGGSVEAVLAHAAECRERIERIEHAGEREEELLAAVEAAREQRDELGRSLSAGRRDAAPELERAVAAELAALAMEGARLEVALHPVGGEDGHGPGGAESVELLVAPNRGLPLSPLRDSASGGELSRVMLALAGLAAADAPGGTLVFDEIDAGIGGQVARRVGERLRALGEHRQVVCITHLPQVAALAGAHYRMEKDTAAATARATVERVGGERLVAEIVRMLGAEDDDEAADRHARELLAA
jgi:DNA repair protein RecN (Recombination protein N)